MTVPFAERNCHPGAARLDGAAVTTALAGLPASWALDGEVLVKRFGFADFAAALAFVNRVGALADAQDHHPDVELAWGRVVLRIWTHDAGGLTENDFILAARADALSAPTPPETRAGRS